LKARDFAKRIYYKFSRPTIARNNDKHLWVNGTSFFADTRLECYSNFQKVIMYVPADRPWIVRTYISFNSDTLLLNCNWIV